MIIISETRRGEAHPHSSYIMASEEAFIGRTREYQLLRYDGRPFSDKQKFVVDLKGAIEWMNNSFAQLTEVITKDNYIIGHSTKVDELANELGWNDE